MANRIASEVKAENRVMLDIRCMALVKFWLKVYGLFKTCSHRKAVDEKGLIRFTGASIYIAQHIFSMLRDNT